jgi:hypothetical protein
VPVLSAVHETPQDVTVFGGGDARPALAASDADLDLPRAVNDSAGTVEWLSRDLPRLTFMVFDRSV